MKSKGNTAPNAKTGSFTQAATTRVKSASAVAAAAYRSGENLADLKAGNRHNYANRSGVVDSFIEAPEGAPDWARERSSLWNAVEFAEKRKDSQLFREVQVGLQRELSIEQQTEIVRDFVHEHFVSKGMIADIAIHQDSENHNPHAHIMLTMRELKEDGFGNKVREWNDWQAGKGKNAIAETGRAAGGGGLVSEWRETWADTMNKALEAAGEVERIDHRSNAEAGIERVPENMSPAAMNMEARGTETEQGDKLATAQAENAALTQRAAFHAEIENHEKQQQQEASFVARLSSWWDNFSGVASALSSSVKDGFSQFVEKQRERSRGSGQEL